MRLLSFKGGIHPDDNKSATNSIPIESLAPPQILVIPMRQHIGAPAEPCVKKGDYIKMWQKIGEAKAFMSSNVHSSVSGEVISIEPRLTANGDMVNSVVIKNDFLDAQAEKAKPPAPGSKLSDIVREAGIVGMGGAAFPTHIKLSPPEGKKIDTIIVNGSECEPYLTSDHRVMLESPAEIVTGLRFIMNGLGVSDGCIAVEANKRDAAASLNAYINENGKDIPVMVLKTKYPQGSEKQLIYAVTGKEIPSGSLPMDVGVIVVNIDTCTAIARAAQEGIPLVKRIVTVSGPIVKEPKNLEVRIGTSVKDIIEGAGGTTEEIGKAIMGGPMMGIALSSLDVPLVKGAGAVILFPKEDAVSYEETPCIRCGSCISACPINLLPLELNRSALKGDIESCKKFNITDCIECGACTYICPAKRQIVQSIRVAKDQLKKRSVKE